MIEMFKGLTKREIQNTFWNWAEDQTMNGVPWDYNNVIDDYETIVGCVCSSDNFVWSLITNLVHMIHDGKCCNCGCMTGLVVDHIVPKTQSIGQWLDVNNLQLLCTKCNGVKYTKVKDYRSVKQRLAAGTMMDLLLGLDHNYRSLLLIKKIYGRIKTFWD